MNAGSFVSPTRSWSPIHFFQPLLSLFSSWETFVVLSPSSLTPFLSAILLLSPSTGFFKLSYFSVLKCPFGCSFVFYFFAETFCFLFVSSMFVSVHWDLFMTAALKSVSDHSHITCILVGPLWLVFHLFWDLPVPSYDREFWLKLEHYESLNWWNPLF